MKKHPKPTNAPDGVPAGSAPVPAPAAPANADDHAANATQKSAIAALIGAGATHKEEDSSGDGASATPDLLAPDAYSAAPASTSDIPPPAQTADFTAVMAEIADLKRQLAEAKAPTPEAVAATPVEAPQAVVLGEEEFITADELATLYSDPSKINAALNKVVARAQEQMLASMPDLIQKTIARTAAQQDATTKFWSENGDLSAHKEYVGFVANKVAGEMPGADTAVLLTEIAKRVRLELGLEQRAAAAEAARTSGPAFAGGNGSGSVSSGQRPLTEAQKGIAATLGIK